MSVLRYKVEGSARVKGSSGENTISGMLYFDSSPQVEDGWFHFNIPVFDIKIGEINVVEKGVLRAGFSDFYLDLNFNGTMVTLGCEESHRNNLNFQIPERLIFLEEETDCDYMQFVRIKLRLDDPSNQQTLSPPSSVRLGAP